MYSSTFVNTRSGVSGSPVVGRPGEHLPQRVQR